MNRMASSVVEMCAEEWRIDVKSFLKAAELSRRIMNLVISSGQRNPIALKTIPAGMGSLMFGRET